MRVRCLPGLWGSLMVLFVACGDVRPGTEQPDSLPATVADSGMPHDGATPAATSVADATVDGHMPERDGSTPTCSGCLIEGHCHVSGEKLPLDPCHVCDPDRRQDAWSDDDGRACDDGDLCTERDQCRAGSCAGEPKSCSDGVQCNGEETCAADRGTCQPGTPTCASNLHCNLQDDACEATCFGCLIAGVCYPDGAPHPTEACLACDVARASAAWSAREGVSCAEPGECHQGGTCNAQGQCALRTEPRGTDCGEGARQCSSWSCDGQGACVLEKSTPDQPCGELGPCRVQGFCDGAGGCAGSGVRELGERCEEHAVCTGDPSAPSCTCAPGFERVDGKCVDIDECARGLDGCDGAPDACVNHEGGYACACPEGYDGDGKGVRGCRCGRPDYSPLCKPYTELDARNGQLCAISDGALFCSGTQGLVRVGDGRGWQHVSAGPYHICGIAGGALYCWGKDNYGSLGLGGESSEVPRQVGSDRDWFAVGAGEYTTCGLRGNGELYCWGDLLKVNVPTRLGSMDGYEQLSFGHRKHGCVRKAGALYCWGENYYGEVGDGTYARRAEPVPVGAPDGWTHVSAGNGTTCALREGGSLWCWGGGRLGASPSQMDGFADWTRIDTGDGGRCGVRDGKAYCWGYMSPTGDGGLVARTAPAQLALEDGWQSFSLASSGTCGLRDGGLYCWGSSLGVPAPTPQRVDGLSDYLHVGAGDFHTCAVRRGGELMCWGTGQANPLSGQEKPWMPRRVGEDSDWTAVVGSYSHACGVRGTGELYCWGSNDSYQLGVGGSIGSSKQPMRVGDGQDWRSVSVSSSQGCGLRGEQGEVYCWGANAGAKYPVPTLIAGDNTGYSQVSSGGYYGCGVREGKGVCWGFDHAGALGIGLVSSSDLFKPTVIGPPSEFVTVQARYRNSCGIDGGGQLYCWGENNRGQLGTGGPTESATTPAAVASQERFAQVSVGDGRSCAVSQAGALYCWGSNLVGVPGAGSGPIPTPTRLDGTGWAEVSVASNHTCAIRAGELYCWGYNAYGQLGTSAGIVPTPVVRGDELQ